MIPFKTRIKSGVVQRLEVIESLSYQGNEIVPGAATDELAKISSNDTTAGYLNGKLVAGSGIVLTENNNGGNETLTISANAVDLDVKVSVSANDTTAGYLNGKLVAGTGITFTENNNGGDETLTVTLAAHTHAASDVTSGVLGTARLATTGTASASTYLRGDQSWSGLDAGHITSGTVATARLGTGTASSSTYLKGDQTYAGLDAGHITSGTVPTARLATGTANSTTYLRGDQTWQTIASGVTGFTPSQNTASPNNVVNASRLLVDVATTNGDIVLQPKGTGAFVAQLADGTSTGGNKRGVYAVDLQRGRSSADQVASGYGAAILGGETNKASNQYSTVCGGFSNVSSGEQSFVGSGLTNTASGNNSVVVGGQGNSAAGNASVVVGGASNLANAQYSVISGGQFHNVSGAFSGVASGYYNRVSSDYSAILGGNNNEISFGSTYNAIINGSGNYSISGSYVTIIGRDNRNEGYNSDALLVGRYTESKHWAAAHQVYSASRFAANGDCQRMEFMLSRGTINNTATELTLDGGSPFSTGAGVFTNRLYLGGGGSSAVYAFDGVVMAKLVGGSSAKAWRITGGIRLHSGTLTLISSSATELFSTGSAWSIAAAADTTNTALLINVTGGASETIRWNAHLHILKVAG